MHDNLTPENELDLEGMVFNIQKYSVHDGPGIRTLVFLKGCALRCRWCSNPESQNHHPELAWNEGRCIGLSKCGHCLDACKHGALSTGPKDKPIIDRALCKDCEIPCVDACAAQGFIVYGRKRTVKDVLDQVEKDMAFYSRSGGGMTLSGGEPLLQRDFAVALLKNARKRRMKTAIETCGMVPAETIRLAAPHLKYVLFDLKHLDSEKHKANTGAGNERILENFQILTTEFPELPVKARTPVIPGFNDTPEEISKIAEYIKPYENVEYELLPYHRLGTQKYLFLNRKPPMGDVTLDKARMSPLIAKAKEILGKRVHVPH